MALSNSSSQRLTLVKRKDLGAFYTPSPMANFAAAWAIRSKGDHVLDPGCGDAAFLLSAARRLTSCGAPEACLASQLFGIDLNADAVETAASEFSKTNLQPPTLIQGNFFDFSAGLFSRTLPAFDAVIGNPPYVRYQLFRDENRTLGLRAAAQAGVILPQLASSWAPYLIHAATFLKPGGRLAMVLPGELLHVGYAAAVRTFLLQNFEDLHVIAFEENVFPGALEEVVIVLGTRGVGDGKLRVQRLRTLEDLAPGPDVILRKSRQCAVAPGQRWLTALFEEESLSDILDVVLQARFRPLGELGRVDIGAVTGANDFFILTESQVTENQIPSPVLLPVVSKAAHIQGALFTAADWKNQVQEGHPAYLLVTDKESASGPVARYIKKGEAAGLQNRYKCRTRDPWYRVPYVRRPDLFLTYMNHVLPRLAVNHAKATNSNTLHGIFLSDPLLAEPLAAAFLNSATLMSVEIEGRSYGGGVLKLEPGEATRILFPAISTATAEKLRSALPKIDRLLRDGQTDEASAAVDTLIFGRRFPRRELERVRSALASLRARRLTRGKKQPSALLT